MFGFFHLIKHLIIFLPKILQPQKDPGIDTFLGGAPPPQLYFTHCFYAELHGNTPAMIKLGDGTVKTPNRVTEANEIWSSDEDHRPEWKEIGFQNVSFSL